MAILCPSCGSELIDDAAVCANCASSGPVSSTLIANTDAGSESAVNAPTFATDTDLKGIGGWLILQAIGLAIAPFVSLAGVITDLKILNGPAYQAGLHAKPDLALLILFEASTNVIMMLALIGLNVLFYRTRRSFPRWMITFFVGAFIVTLGDHLWAVHFLPTSWAAVGQRFVAAAIWIPYFLQSRRVEQTFVN